MRVIFTSMSVLLTAAGIDAGAVDLLKKLVAAGQVVGVISNHVKPEWFDDVFAGSDVQFIHRAARQDGVVIGILAKSLNVKPYEILVLAANRDDIAMAKNGGAMLIAAGWVQDQAITEFGVKVSNFNELNEVIDLIDGWVGHWWAECNTPTYNVRALADLSSLHKAPDQVAFSQVIKDTVKNGGVKLTALLAICARSLLIDKFNAEPDLFFCVYPSSNSSNDDTEVLSDFTHRLRSIVSKVRMARRGEPLFIRHKPSIKRSSSKGANRLDPSDQVESIFLDSRYKKQIRGRHVIVVDDCTTYGASFGVASAFLLKAGAASVTGVALGKFGNQFHYFNITIGGDPFAPVGAGAYSFKPVAPSYCATDVTAQALMRNLL